MQRGILADPISGTAVLEYGPTEILPPVGAISKHPTRLCRPGRQASRAHPRGKPGFSTLDNGCGRETDCLLEGNRFELPVPRHCRGFFSGHSQRGSVADPKVCKLAAGGKRIRTAGPSRKRVVSPTEREMPRERKGESRQRQLSFGAPNVRTRLPPPARLTRVTEHSLRRLLKDFELFGFAVRNSKSSPYSVL